VFHRRKGLSDDWSHIAESSLAAWGSFAADEQAQLAEIADWLVRHKHWEAAHGFELSDEILTVLALTAAVLVLGLDTDYYREVSAIVVFPTTIMSRGEYAGPVRGTVTDGVVPVLGQAHDRRGAILIAWDEARDAALYPGHGHNVVFHEFAHKLDMLDDVTDGTPPLPKEQLARWVAVCTEVYESLQSGAARPPLDPYAATNPAEFFAVATEAFLDASVALETHERDLYEVLGAFYNQDPAARARRYP
jgi:Mlc titration factor MtfA (ptsG expression regulator)